MYFVVPERHKYIEGRAPVVTHTNDDGTVSRKLLVELGTCKVCGFMKKCEWHIKD